MRKSDVQSNELSQFRFAEQDTGVTQTEVLCARTDSCWTGAGRINDFPGKRLGRVFRQGPAARLPAGAEHTGLGGVVSQGGEEVQGRRRRHAVGLFSRRYAKPRLRMRHLGAGYQARKGKRKRSGRDHFHDDDHGDPVNPFRTPFARSQICAGGR